MHHKCFWPGWIPHSQIRRSLTRRRETPLPILSPRHLRLVLARFLPSSWPHYKFVLTTEMSIPAVIEWDSPQPSIKILGREYIFAHPPKRRQKAAKGRFACKFLLKNSMVPDIHDPPPHIGRAHCSDFRVQTRPLHLIRAFGPPSFTPRPPRKNGSTPLPG